MEKSITYFENPGEENTAAVFALVDEALEETGIRKIVLASTWGGTARYAMDHYGDKGVKLVIVPHQFGFGPNGQQRFSTDLVDRARKEGHQVCFSTMLFHQEKLFGPGAAQVVADFLRVFCQGVKVCVEIALMAANSGMVEPGEQFVCVAGTGRGADTALIMTGATSVNPKQLHISRILCKPL